MRIPFAIVGWLVVAVLKIGLAAIGGLLVIPIALKLGVDMKKLPIWGNAEEGPPQWFLNKGRPAPNWWWYAIRNPVNNTRYLVDEPLNITTYGTEIDDSSPGFQWRYRHSQILDSFRVVWGEPTENEIYLGWKIGSSVPGVGFAMSWRPVWQPVLLIALVTALVAWL